MLSMLVAINIPCLIFKERENTVYNTKHLKLIIFDSTYKILSTLMTQSALQKNDFTERSQGENPKSLIAFYQSPCSK